MGPKRGQGKCQEKEPNKRSEHKKKKFAGNFQK